MQKIAVGHVQLDDAESGASSQLGRSDELLDDLVDLRDCQPVGNAITFAKGDGARSDRPPSASGVNLPPRHGTSVDALRPGGGYRRRAALR